MDCLEKISLKKKLLWITGIGTLMLFVTEDIRKRNMIRKQRDTLQKDEKIIQCFSKWFVLKKSGNTISNYLKKNGYQKIAIYGFGYLGRNLYEELKGSEIEVQYVIDRKAPVLDIQIPAYKSYDMFPEADAVIVTLMGNYKKAVSDLEDGVSCPILSFEDILYEMLYEERADKEI